jgi:4-amino-4-deoxy-L-arabinose transferase-like glycosyltransferase
MMIQIPEGRRLNYTLITILLIALCARVVFVLTLENRFYFPDSYGYDAMAKNIISGKGFIVSENLQAGRAPLYPGFLAVCYTLFGEKLLVIRLIQALLSTFSCLLVYLIAKRIFNSSVGIIATLITALYPFFVFFSGLILSETVFIFLLLLLVYLLVVLEQYDKWWLAAAAGVINACAILTRPSFVLFFVFLGLFWFLKAFRVKGLMVSRIKSYLVIIIFTCLTMSPWVIRNYLVFDKFIPVTATGGLALYEANSPYATGGCAPDWDLPAAIKKLPEADYDAILRKMAVQYIKDNPMRFIKLSMIKFSRFWNVVPNFDEYRSIKYALASIFSFGVVLLFALWEIFRLRKQWRLIIILLTPVFYFTLIHMVFIGSIRYRIPIEPYLIILAASSLVSLLVRLKLIAMREKG